MAVELGNETQFDFMDISSEQYREYVNDRGEVWYRVEHPQWLAVSDSGGHRILDEAGVCHYVQPEKCFAIRWKVYADMPHFVR